MCRPTTTDDALIDALSMGEMVRFGWVSKEAQAKVISYIKRHFNISKVLKPFVSASDIDDFRRLMARTDMIISGSIALQFFARVTWPSSDTDLYVEKIHAAQIAAWLIEHDFVFQPCDQNPISWQEITHCTPDVLPDSCLCFEPLNTIGYILGDTVLNFKNNRTGRLAQVVMCNGTPLQSVLNFHSSTFLYQYIFDSFTDIPVSAAVLNIITHDYAYCLYPKATLDKKKSLYLPSAFATVPHVMSALNKYRDRGWDVVNRLHDYEAFGDEPLFPFGPRRVSDAKSLKIRWCPVLDIPSSTIDINSWIVSYDGSMIPQFHGVLCRANRLRRSYILSCDKGEDYFQSIWKKLQEKNPGDR